MYVWNVCLNERKELEALGLLTEIKDEFTATILMLRDVFDAMQSLNLVLQKGDGSVFVIFQIYVFK